MTAPLSPALSVRARAARAALPCLVGAAVFAVLAAWNPGFSRRGDRARLGIVAWDLSHSAARAAPAVSDVRMLWESTFPGDLPERIGVISFAADARISAAPVPPRELASSLRATVPQPFGSSIATVLRTIASMRRADSEGTSPCDVVVSTDGRFTDSQDEMRSAALELRAAGGARIRWSLIESPEDARCAVHMVSGPGSVAAGRLFTLVVSGRAPERGRTMIVQAGGVTIATRTVSGAFRVSVPRIEDEPGLATFRAWLAGGEGVPESAAEARVIVRRPGSVLVLSGRDASSVTAAAAFLGGRWTIRDRRARDAAAAPSSFLLDASAADFVVAAGLSADESDPLVPALTSFVQGGGGLVLTGGDWAFGAGGWAGREIDAISALRSRPPGGPGAALVIAVDVSGSMGEAWRGADGRPARRADVVRAAAETILSRVPSDTRVTALAFRDRVVESASGADACRSLFASLPAPAGATSILPALERAAADLAATPAGSRTIVILGDGRSSEPVAPLRDAIARLAAGNTRLVIVTPGPADPDAPALAAARAAGIAVLDAEFPHAFAELVRSDPRILDGGEVFAGRSLSVSPPAVSPSTSVTWTKRNRAWLGEGATPLLVTDAGEPVAASRVLGRGVVTSIGASLGWAEDGHAALLAILSRGAGTPPAAMTVERDGDRLLLRVPGASDRDQRVAEICDARGGVRSVRLRPAGHGLHEADLGESGSTGPAGVALRVLGPGGEVLGEAGIDRLAPDELRDPEVADLEALAALCRGEPGGAFERRGRALWASLGALCVLAWAVLRVKSPRSAAR